MERIIRLQSDCQYLELFGSADRNLKIIRDELNVKITARDSNIIINGSDLSVAAAVDVIDRLQSRVLDKKQITRNDLTELLTQVKKHVKIDKTSAITVFSSKSVIEPFTAGQKKYIETIQDNYLTFCTGPAGTGKTYLAVAVAVSMLKKKQVRKIQ